MFEVDGKYANRIGSYTVLSIDEPLMTVRYEDGTTAELKVAIQLRIWENIAAEQELVNRRSAKRSRRNKAAPTVRHFVKVVNVVPGEELSFPGWEERVVMAPSEELAEQIKPGDRLIYFSPEAMAFFAVATITGEPFTANPKKYTYTVPETKAVFFQIDRDADTGTLDKGVPFDSVELENCPDFTADPVVVETFCPISEDDFELLSEAVTEIHEENDEMDLLDEDDDFEEDDD